MYTIAQSADAQDFVPGAVQGGILRPRLSQSCTLTVMTVMCNSNKSNGDRDNFSLAIIGSARPLALKIEVQNQNLVVGLGNKKFFLNQM